MKLELKHLAPYLPCGLDAINKDNKQMAIMGCLDEQTVVAVNNGCLRGYNLKYVKPILRPLSSMTNDEAYEFGILAVGEADMEDKEVGVGEMKLMGDTYPTIMYQDQEDEEYSVMIQFSSIGVCMSGIMMMSYEAYEWLFKNHFDVFDLINNDLAIEKTK